MIDDRTVIDGYTTIDGQLEQYKIIESYRE